MFYVLLFITSCATTKIEKKKKKSKSVIQKNESLKAICKERGIPYPPENLRMVLNKSSRRLKLFINNNFLKSYMVAVGERIDAARLYEGDNATPEGVYKILLKQKGADNRYMLLNYPTLIDMKRYKKAVEEGAVPGDKTGKVYPVGGGVKIFAGDTTKPTQGGIALKPEEFKEFFKVIRKGTPITIVREVITADQKIEQLGFKRPLFKITDAPARDIGPKFSPDGKYISFSRIDRLYNDVWVFEQNTNSLRRVTIERSDLKGSSFGESEKFSYGGIWGNDPEKIIIISSFKGNFDIFLYDLTEDKFVLITKHQAWDGDPAWSHDGERMVFVSARTGNGDLWIKKIGRYYFSNPSQLTDNPGIDFAPVWSHDNQKVFYTSRQFDNYDIYMIDIDERIPIRLTYHESADRYVSVSPDGKKIAFFSDFNISVMDLEGIDFTTPEVQEDANGWRYKELSSSEMDERITVIIPYITVEITENRGGRLVKYKKNRQFIQALTFENGPLWTSDGNSILFVANKPLKPIYSLDLTRLKDEGNHNIYEINSESEIHRDMDLSRDGRHLVFSTFRNDYSKYNNNVTMAEFTDPPARIRKRETMAKTLPEFLTREAKTWYQITNPPPQDVSFINRGRTGLISGTGVVGLSGGR